MTVTLPLLNAAAFVLFVLLGEGKAEAMRDVVAAVRDPALRTAMLPAARVAPRKGTVMFLADAAAARRVPPEWRIAG